MKITGTCCRGYTHNFGFLEDSAPSCRLNRFRADAVDNLKPGHAGLPPVRLMLGDSNQVMLHNGRIYLGI